MCKYIVSKVKIAFATSPTAEEIAKACLESTEFTDNDVVYKVRTREKALELAASLHKEQYAYYSRNHRRYYIDFIRVHKEGESVLDAFVWTHSYALPKGKGAKIIEL